MGSMMYTRSGRIGFGLDITWCVTADAFFFFGDGLFNPSAMSASSRNLAPLFGVMFRPLSHAAVLSTPLVFERGLIQRSFAKSVPETRILAVRDISAAE